MITSRRRRFWLMPCLLLAALLLPATSYAAHARPKGATPLHASLVPAYSACASPDRTHGPPLGFPSCAQPLQTSGFLTVGTPDANGAAPNSIASVRLVLAPGLPGPPHDTQVFSYINITDVRCAPGATPCGSANAQGGPDYTGQIVAEATLRITDQNVPSSTDHTTMTDYVLRLPITCAATASTATGATCIQNNELSNYVPGIVPEGGRAIWEFGAVRVSDGGPDGVASTADNTVFLTQGIFIP